MSRKDEVAGWRGTVSGSVDWTAKLWAYFLGLGLSLSLFLQVTAWSQGHWGSSVHEAFLPQLTSLR